MSSTEFMYKGKKIIIRDDHPDAVISVDGREFSCHHHHGEEGELAMWMCEEAYFASPDIKELARHFADYGYMFNDPNRVVVDEAGEVVAKGTSRKKSSGKKSSGKKKPPGKKKGTGGHGTGGGH